MPRKAIEPPVNPILVADLPTAEEAALATFDRLPGNIYQNVNIGKAYGNDEGTSCDCHFIPGQSFDNLAADVYLDAHSSLHLAFYTGHATR